jgi:DNA-binding response OmpR family regulator
LSSTGDCYSLDAFSGGPRGAFGRDGSDDEFRCNKAEDGVKRILVVDDSTTMRQLIKMVLMKQVACEIVEAQDGLDALGKLKAGGFDLVVTDVNMPRLDGLGLVQGIRESLKSAVPVIIVTTKGGEADRDRGMQLGANAYLTKPLNGAQIVKTVGELLG